MTESTTERWTYIGRRINGTELQQAWLDEEGMSRYFTARKLSHRAVGATYELSVTRGDGAVRAGVAGATFIAGPDDDDVRVPGWELEDRAAWVADEARKAEAKLKRDGDAIGDLTLREFRQRLLASPSSRRGALIAVLLRYIGA